MVSSMDAMTKYSMEADKYRAAYIPPSSLAMSMYTDPKYLDSSPKSYLERGWNLDSAKMYLEQSKFYMDQKSSASALSDFNRSSSYEANKLDEDSSPSAATTRSPTAESPDINKQQIERADQDSSSATSTPSAWSPGSSLSSYYSATSAQTGGILPPQIGQYPSYQGAPGEFRRPLVIL